MLSVEEVLQMSDEDFRKYVDEDVRAPEPFPALRDPQVVPRWFEQLLASKRSIEGQFGAEKKRIASLHFEAEKDSTNSELKQRLREERVRYTRWKSGALRFNSGLETRLREARTLLPKVDPTRLTEEVLFLRAAIRRHKENIDPEDASIADQELWSLA